MPAALTFLAVVLVAVLLAVIFNAARRGDNELLERRTAELEASQRRLAEAQALVRRLRELAWENREQAPLVTDVLLAEIRSYEDRRPPELGS